MRLKEQSHMRVKSTVGLKQRLLSLKASRDQLDEDLRQGRKRPYMDEHQIADLKKLRVKVKDEIQSIEMILSTVEQGTTANAA